MAFNTPPSESPLPAGMGNTINAVSIGSVNSSDNSSVSPALTATTAHNVLNKSTSLFSNFATGTDQKHENETDLFSRTEHKSNAGSRNSFHAAAGTRPFPSQSWGDMDIEERERKRAAPTTSQARTPTPPHPIIPTVLIFPSPPTTPLTPNLPLLNLTHQTGKCYASALT